MESGEVTVEQLKKKQQTKSQQKTKPEQKKQPLHVYTISTLQSNNLHVHTSFLNDNLVYPALSKLCSSHLFFVFVFNNF